MPFVVLGTPSFGWNDITQTGARQDIQVLAQSLHHTCIRLDHSHRALSLGEELTSCREPDREDAFRHVQPTAHSAWFVFRSRAVPCGMSVPSRKSNTGERRRVSGIRRWSARRADANEADFRLRADDAHAGAMARGSNAGFDVVERRTHMTPLAVQTEQAVVSVVAAVAAEAGRGEDHLPLHRARVAR